MLQNSHKTLGYEENMVYKIPPGDGGGGKPYLANGLMYLVTFGYGLISFYYYLSLCSSLVIAIFDVSKEGEGVYGILCFELFPLQGSHKISLDILFDKGLPCSTYGNSKVYKIEI